MCVYFYCTLRVLIKKSKARPGNKSGIKEEKIGQQDDQTIFFQFFKGFLKDYKYYRLCTYFMEKRTTTSKRIKLWRQVWDVLLFGSPISRMLIWLKK